MPTETAAARALVTRLRGDRIAWARHCFRILNKHGKTVPLVANAAQRFVHQAEQQQLRERGYVRLFVLKGRQGGVSTWEQASNLHQIWSDPGFNAITLAHTRDDVDKLFGITQMGVEHFPPALLPNLGGKETREISFPELRTKFWTGTAGAARTGRGLTLKRVHLSEFALYETPLETLGALTPALVPVGSSITIETTASGYDSPAHQFWQSAETGANDYGTLFIPWWLCDVEHYRFPLLADDELGALEPDERDLVERHGLDLEQIKWRRAKMRELGRGTFLQEYAEDAETCWAAAGGMFFDAEQLKALLARAPTPTAVELGGALERYAEHGNERVVIGCDTAEGVGGDRSTFIARTYPGRRLLATIASTRIEPRNLAELLNTYGRQFSCGRTPAFLVVEKNAHGITVLRELRDSYSYPATSLYHRATQDTTRKEASADRLGWLTSAETKPLLLDAARTVFNGAEDGQIDVPCAGVLRDAFGVRLDPLTGKVELNGKDMLVSEMLCEIGQHAFPAPALIGRAGGPARTPAPVDPVAARPVPGTTLRTAGPVPGSDRDSRRVDVQTQPTRRWLGGIR